MSILTPSNLETADYGTPGWNYIYSTNFEKLNDYLAKFEDLWNSTPTDWNILRYDSTTSKWIKDTIANLSVQLETYLAKIDLSNVDDTVILTKLENIDGSGSGLDADLIDGFHASQTPGASLVVVAESTGKINHGWIPISVKTLQNNYTVTLDDDYLLVDCSNNLTVNYQIAIADGTTSSYTVILVEDLVLGSVEITYTIGGTNYTAVDNALGKIEGYGLTGGVNYTNGTISLNFSTLPDANTPILANFKQAKVVITLPVLNDSSTVSIKKIDSTSYPVELVGNNCLVENLDKVTIDSQNDCLKLVTNGINWYIV